MRAVLVRRRLHGFFSGLANPFAGRLLIAALAFALVGLGFAQTEPSTLYATIQSEATGYTTAFRNAALVIVGGVVGVMFAIAFAKKILAAK